MLRNDREAHPVPAVQPVLEAKDVHVHYGGIHALQGISLQIQPGEIVTLIGPNGSGKSTLLRAISGTIRPSAGEVRIRGTLLPFGDPQRAVKSGVAHVPEGRGIFGNLTVAENLGLGAYLRHDRPRIAKDLEHVYELFPILKERASQSAGTLSGGEQQMLAIGRGLMMRPRILLLDEPSLGLAPLLVRKIFEILEKINEEGCTILLVEQNAHLALRLAHRGYVLETGRIILTDKANALLHNEAVRKAYLGE